MSCSHEVTQPHFLMENSTKRSSVGLEVMENSASPTPGTESIAHCPGICPKGFLPFTPTTRKVLTSGVSTRMSVTTARFGIKGSVLMRAASQRIDDLDNVHMNRTLLQTPAAANAAENTVVIVREIDQLM